MIFEAKEIVLKNGARAVFKTPEKADAALMLDYIKKACGETPYLLRYPEEWEDTSIAQEESWIEQGRSATNKLLITCYVDGKAIGNCELAMLGGMKTRHRASVAIAILKDYWGLGIGSMMFCEMIAAAKNAGVEIMELEFIEGNARARGLYEKFGFGIVSVKPSAFKLKDGGYLNEYYMQKRL